jgi:membrane protein DedA with SNARE-associated domain
MGEPQRKYKYPPEAPEQRKQHDQPGTDWGAAGGVKAHRSHSVVDVAWPTHDKSHMWLERSGAHARRMSKTQASSLAPARAPDGTRAAAAWRRFAPWHAPATGIDMALMGAILGVVALGLALRPLKPFLIASHPVALEFLTGDLTSIGAAAAFARIGEAPLWLVIVAGAAGMVKLDWLTWWTGRQWGPGIIRMFTTSERALRLSGRSTELDRRIVWVAIVFATLPGVPTAVIYAMAGWAGVRLATFLLLDLLGALLMTGLVAGLGYGLGQYAVDLVLLVDRFASVVSLTLIAVAVVIPLVKASHREA